MDSETIMYLFTAILAAATAWLAVETRRMASAAKAQVSLLAQPQLSFRGIDFNEANITNFSSGGTDPGLGMQLKLGNPGSTLVHYSVDELRSSLCGTTIPSDATPPAGGVIHPGEDTWFMLPIVPIVNSRLLPSYALSFLISYWAIAQERKSVRATLVINILNKSPLRWQWIYKSGPEYA